jgi:hypothetical protein
MLLLFFTDGVWYDPALCDRTAGLSSVLCYIMPVNFNPFSTSLENTSRGRFPAMSAER